MKSYYSALIVLVLIIFNSQIITPQWVLTNGPFLGDVYSVVLSGTNILAGTDDGIYISANNGLNWNKKIIGPCWAFVTSGTNLYASSSSGFLVSTNNGVNWLIVNSNLPLRFTSLAVCGTKLIGGASGGLYISTDNGISWNQPTGSPRYVTSLAVSGASIFAGTDGDGLKISTNNGTNWFSSGLAEWSISSLYAQGSNIFAGTSSGVYLSSNNGTSWSNINTGLTNTNITTLAANLTGIFAGTYGGVFISINNGISWSEVSTGLTNKHISFLTSIGTNIFIVTHDGIFCSTNSGVNWNPSNTGLQNYFYSFVCIGNDIFEGSYSGLSHSTNSGVSWTNDYTIHPTCSAVNGTNIFAGTNGAVYLSTNNGTSWVDLHLYQNIYSIASIGTNIIAGTGNGLYVSTNSGTSWAASTTGLPTPGTIVSNLVVKGTNLFASTSGEGAGVYLSNNNGINWTNTNFPKSYISFLAGGINCVYAATSFDGIFFSTNNGTNWNNTNFPFRYVRSLAVSGSNLFAGTNNGIYYTSNYGTNWTDISVEGQYPIFRANDVWCLGVSGTNLYVSMGDSIYYTFGSNPYAFRTDYDLVFTRPLSDFALPISNNQMPLIGQNNKLNFGATNILLDLTVSTPAQISATFYENKAPQPGNLPSGINKASEYYWTISAPGISFNNGYIEVPISSLKGINNSANLVWLKRSNSGDAWTNIGGIITAGNLVSTVPFSSFSEFAIGTSGNDPMPVELSSFSSVANDRTVQLKWETKTEKNSDKFVIERKTLNAEWEVISSVKASVLSNSPKQYSYLDNKLQSGKYQYRLKMIDNDGSFKYSQVVEAEVALPKDFDLSQNYPNPFNPTTKINYNLPYDSKVTLEVYNTVGERIAQLVNKEQPAGYYSVDYGSSKFSSGIYFYRMTAVDKATGKNFSSIKKMILLK